MPFLPNSLFSSTRRTAFAALAAAGLIWGLTVPLSKVALGWLDPAWLAVARFALAAPVLALAARRGLRGAVSPAVLAWGAVAYGAVIVLQNLGIARTSVSHAALIVGAVPALVALTAAALGRGTAGPLAWSGFVVALAGVGIVAGSGGQATLEGDLLVLAAAALSAFYIVAQSRLLAGRSAVAVTAVQMAAGAAAALPVALAAEGLPSAGPEPATAAAFAALVVLGSLLPFALYAYGQAHVAPEVAGAFVNLEPLVGAAVGAFAFHDPFGAIQLAGAAAILAGIVLSVEPGPALRRLRPWAA